MLDSGKINTKTLIKTSVLLVFIIPLLFSLPTLGNQNSQEKLSDLKKQISQIKQGLKAKESKRDEASDKIADFDKKIAKLSARLREINQQLSENTDSISNIKQEKAQLLVSQKKSRSDLASVTKTFYVMGKQNYLKSLLNQDDPNKHGRVSTYYYYLNTAFQEEHKKLNKTLEEVSALELSLISALSRKRDLLKKIEQETQNIVEKRNQREAYLTKLTKQIRNEKKQIARLTSDQKALEKLAKAIGKIKSPSKISQSSGIGFAKRKGGLNWPVSGKVIRKFGKPRLGGKLKWRGILIETQAGSDVRAVSNGQVVFSDWISGYGYVLIVDHGKNYMSLYGHNQQLLKDVGDFIKRNEIIAEAGNSGRSGEPALYFEIRYKGKPVNPAKWIAMRDRKRK